MQKRNILVRTTVFWAGLTFTALSIAIPPVHHLLYLLPFLVFLTVLGDRKVRLGAEAKPFIAFVLAGIFFSPFSNMSGLKDLFFTLAGISVAFLIDIPRLRLWTMFITLLACMAIYFSFFYSLSPRLNFDIVNSHSPFEGPYSFMFGLICLFALMEKKYWLFIFSFIMAIFTLKRIVLVAVICASAIFLIGEKRCGRFLKPSVMIAFNCILLLIVLLYGYGTFDSAIGELTGQSANQLGQGRRALLSLPASEMLHRPLRFIFFGEGPGASYVLADRAFGSYVTGQLLHSDILKISYEYGLTFFILFIGLMYSHENFPLRVSFLFLNVLFLTDNTLIYSFMLFFFICFARSIQGNGSEEQHATARSSK